MSIALSPKDLYYRTHLPEAPDPRRLPVIFLHGLMGFAANWGKTWPHFQKDRPALVYDQRGHGRSAKPQTGYSPQDYAADCAALMDELGWQKAHIVGHSMGGRVALFFAKLYPQKTASLTMEDSGAEARGDRIFWIKNLLGSIPTPFSSREDAKHFFSTHFANDPITGPFLFSNLELKANGQLDWRFHAAGMVETIEKGRARDAMDILKSTSCPTLLIRGEWSREFTADEAERMRALRHDIELVTIKGAGHYVHTECPQEFNSVLADFLLRQEA